jgi:hypothetical protein
MPEVANPFAQKHSYSHPHAWTKKSSSWNTIEPAILGYTVTHPDDIRKKVIDLQKEIDEIHFANIKYAMQRHRNDFQREAYSRRKQRLSEIMTELADMTGWRKAG